jgi:hypothetical protein
MYSGVRDRLGSSAGSYHRPSGRGASIARIELCGISIGEETELGRQTGSRARR